MPRLIAWLRVQLGVPTPMPAAVGQWVAGAEQVLVVGAGPVGVVMARMQQAIAGIPGITAFFQPVQDIQIGTRVSRTQFQYTLMDTDQMELAQWAPKLLHALAAAPALTNVRSADGNLLADFTQSGALTGTFSGTFETTGHLIVYPDGRLDVHGFITFTGATACGSGTVRFVGNDQTVGGVGTGTVMTVDGAQNTAGIHAVVDLALAGPTFTYSGSYHCGN